LYEPLILDEELAAAAQAGEETTFLDHVNNKSLEIIQGFVEPTMKDVKPQDKFQFFRHGYFNVDPKHTTAEKPVFNMIVSLKSSFKL
jgi:glutaminyl-tRNA synthetase